MKDAIKYISITVLSMSFLTAYAVDTTPLGENYECQRTDSSGNTVSYPVTVAKTKATYTFQWQTGDTPVIYGTGVINPKVNNAISVIFWDPKNSDASYGVVLFSIKSDGSLNGEWIMRSGEEGSETCTKK